MKWKDDPETYWHTQHIVESASTALLWKTICWFPVHWGKKSMFLPGTLWWTPVFLTGLISYHISSPTTCFCQTLSVSVSPWVSLFPGYLMPSLLPTLAPTAPWLIHLRNVYSFSTIIQTSQWKSSCPIPHSPLVELILGSAVWDLGPTQISIIASSLLWFLIGRRHGIYSELDLISNLRFPLTGLAMQDNLLDQKWSAFYGRERERSGGGVGWGGENGKNML